MIYRNIPQLFYGVCEQYKHNPFAFSYRKDGQYISVTHEELIDKVESLAISLLELGILKNDRIGIVAENSIDWIIASFAISMIGAVDVPLFPILSARQEQEIFSDCQASAVFVSNNFQLNKICEVKDELPHLRQVITFSDKYDQQDVYIHPMSQLIEKGKLLRSKEDRTNILNGIISKIEPDDLLTLIYTSGTTGVPKGVMLSHKNVISNINSAITTIGPFLNERSLMFLPMCHAYERTGGFYTLFTSGCKITLADSIDTVSSQLLDVKPTIITAVPKLLETIKKKVFINISKEPSTKQKIFNWAINIGNKKALDLQNKKSNPITNLRYKLADKLVFSKIREKLGGQLSKIISGGAPLASEVEMFYKAIGVNVAQGYGLTEAAPIVSANNFHDFEFGTIGKPLANVEVRLAEDGEILARGPNIMKGYWNNPEATAEAIDEDGWLHTGDIAIITEMGNIKITDRKKNLFVSSGGKNIAPQPIENLISQSRYVDHCFLVGDNREYITALIAPNIEQLQKVASDFGVETQNIGELINNPKIIRFIKDEIDFYQKDVSKFEKVRKFRLLSEPFSTATGELTPKMSIRRNVVENKYSELINGMYGE